MSDWLITAGLISAAFAIIAFLIDFVGGKQIRTMAWPYAVGYVLAVLADKCLRSQPRRLHGGGTNGLTLSGLVLVILLFSSQAGWVLTSRRRVAVST